MNNVCPRCGGAVPFQLQVSPNSKCALCQIREITLYYDDKIAKLNIKIETILAELARYRSNENSKR